MSFIESNSRAARAQENREEKPYLMYDDFKRYKQMCQTPERSLPQSHHFYLMAIQKLNSKAQ